MNVLCIVQARYHSTRLPGKMLLEIGGETLVARAWRVACEAFGAANCVVALPMADNRGPLGAELFRIRARVFPWDGPESDVLGRLWHCAWSLMGGDIDTTIMRLTPDDWRKDVDSLRRVAAGERLPVEMGGEAFSFIKLDAFHMSIVDPHLREHVGLLLPPAPTAPADGFPWEINTADDYHAACEMVSGDRGAYWT